MLRVRCRAVITNPYGSHGLLQNMQQPYFYRHSPWASNRNRRLGKYLPTGGSYGLFPFHIDLYFKEVPAVIPQSKIRDFCQLPLAREPLECAPKPPLPKGGASAPPRRGDTQAPPGYFLPNHSSLFPKKPSPFHIGLYFEEVSAVESLSHGFAVPAPFGKGAFGVRTKAPLAIVGVVWRSQTGGIPRVAGFHIGLYFEEVPAVESLSRLRRQLPFTREPLECSPVWEPFPRTHFHQGGFFHGNVCR